MRFKAREVRKKGYSLEEARSKMTVCRKELRNSKGDSNEEDTNFSESMSPVMYASILAANSTKHNQFPLGLSDGGVVVKELRRILEMAM
ncbi:hypothetical protein ACET3Z_001763 [Daucus carota]